MHVFNVFRLGQIGFAQRRWNKYAGTVIKFNKHMYN